MQTLSLWDGRDGGPEEGLVWGRQGERGVEGGSGGPGGRVGPPRLEAPWPKSQTSQGI